MKTWSRSWIGALVGLLACTGEPSPSDDEIGETSTEATDDASTDDTSTDDASADDASTDDASTDDASTDDAATTDSDSTDTGEPDAIECEGWLADHPEWIFCDDFEDVGPLVAEGRWFEHADDSGQFVAVDGVGFGGSRAMQAQFEAGDVDAGSLKLGFGRNPVGYMNQGIRPNEDFREIWYRMYLFNVDGWTGDPAKLSRATVFSSPDDWSQAMIAHLWGDGSEHLLIDPVRCVENGQVICQDYNDFANMMWLGNLSGTTAIFSTAESGQWRCVEAHVRLDDPGQANGVQEFWIDGQLEARREDLEFVGDYGEYALNAVFFENYWNDGSVQDQMRWFDNIVVSTAPIGCL